MTYKHPQVEFEPPLIDDTSYEAATLLTKPPRLYFLLQSNNSVQRFKHMSQQSEVEILMKLIFYH